MVVVYHTFQPVNNKGTDQTVWMCKVMHMKLPNDVKWVLINYFATVIKSVHFFGNKYINNKSSLLSSLAHFVSQSI